MCDSLSRERAVRETGGGPQGRGRAPGESSEAVLAEVNDVGQPWRPCVNLGRNSRRLGKAAERWQKKSGSKTGASARVRRGGAGARWR
jgi:hypothetical protein